MTHLKPKKLNKKEKALKDMFEDNCDQLFLEEVDHGIQANLGDSVVQEALKSGVDLREYSADIEAKLR